MINQLYTDNFKTFIFIGIHVLLLMWLASCQNPEEEIDFPADSEAFKVDSELGEYIYGISLLDGSGDNIIDNASNLKIAYPVDVKVKGEPYEVTSGSDLEPIQKIYDLNPYIRDFMAIEYPIEVIRWDHTRQLISNKQELEEANSSSGQFYDDIECVDFIYPISLATYDLINQKASTIEVSDDASLFKTLNDFDEDQLINFNFPISVSVNGNNTQILNNNELQQIIEGELSVCDENDRWYYNDDIVLSTISLKITDAPYPIELIDEANVTIDRIDVKTGAANDSIPFITLFNDTLTFDLTELTNGVTEVLADVDIPVGEYQFFRVYVENGSVRLMNGNYYELKVPSGRISLKPDTPIVITEEGPNEFLFDFDLSRSFIPKGPPNNPNGFNLKPVIKVSSSGETGELSGRITNESSMPVNGVQITLFAADTVSAVTFSGAGGKYMILGLTPGEYLLESEKDGYEMATEAVTIEKGQEHVLDLSIIEL